MSSMLMSANSILDEFLDEIKRGSWTVSYSLEAILSNLSCFVTFLGFSS